MAEGEKQGVEAALESKDLFDDLITGESTLWKGVSDKGKEQVK